ncbi:MAG TPA: prolipoprotein diacylglyceryl transferase [Planctomycetota bacterium]|nr:prolipoprotein diacylglyceryl transferase [Planctomycetota bacterium]
MHPHLFSVPIWLFALLMGGALGATLAGGSIRANVIGGFIGAMVAGVACIFIPAAHNDIPVQGYGVMILTGFIVAVVFCEWRTRQLGIKPFHALDMALWGCVIGLTGARFFHVLMNWSRFNPFAGGSFDAWKIARMFFIWEGGLVYYGAFVTTIPWAYYYCRKHKLPAIPFCDIVVPGLILGQAFGRIGCFMTGCCFGRRCDLPWAVTFPGPSPDVPTGSPAYEQQLALGDLPRGAAHAWPVHPTQLYASIAGFLTYAFLFAYWPRRKYDGQILALTLIMAGTTRFFEEILRTDDPPALPSLSSWMTIAQWLAIPIVVFGFVLMAYFRKRNQLYTPPVTPAPVSASAPLAPASSL